jgi:hypothetical protein
MTTDESLERLWQMPQMIHRDCRVEMRFAVRPDDAGFGFVHRQWTIRVDGIDAAFTGRRLCDAVDKLAIELGGDQNDA